MIDNRSTDPLRALPPRLQQAVEGELLPGEEVRCAFRPAYPQHRSGPLARATFYAFGAMGTAALPLSAWLEGRSPGQIAFFALSAMGCATGTYRGGRAAFEREDNTVYVATNQRAFGLVGGSGGVSVTNLAPIWEARVLARADRAIFLAAMRGVSMVADPNSSGIDGRLAGLSAAGERVPARLRRALNRVLRPGETALWMECPLPREYLKQGPAGLTTAVLLGLGLGSLIFAGLSLFLGLRIEAAELIYMSRLLAVSGLAGCVGAAGVVLHRIYGTLYVLTDRRGIILKAGHRPHTLTRADISGFCRYESARGAGSLTAGPVVKWGAAYYPTLGFYGIRHVRQLDDLIKGRPVRDHSGELIPAAWEGSGGELAASAGPVSLDLGS